jgi:hypothetical protein
MRSRPDWSGLRRRGKEGLAGKRKSLRAVALLCKSGRWEGEGRGVEEVGWDRWGRW